MKAIRILINFIAVPMRTGNPNLPVHYRRYLIPFLSKCDESFVRERGVNNDIPFSNAMPESGKGESLDEV